MSDFDIAIIGAGIAGASLAAEVASHRSVILIEAEAHPGYHSTGRSAAFWDESYGAVSRKSARRLPRRAADASSRRAAYRHWLTEQACGRDACRFCP